MTLNFAFVLLLFPLQRLIQEKKLIFILTLDVCEFVNFLKRGGGGGGGGKGKNDLGVDFPKKNLSSTLKMFELNDISESLAF